MFEGGSPSTGHHSEGFMSQSPLPGIATSGQPESRPEVLHWHAGTGQAIVLSFLFLLLLPFYVSLGPMLFLRLKHGLWVDTIGLLVVATLFSALMGLLLVHLVHTIRSRVRLTASEVSLTLPRVDRGPTPKLGFHSRTIPLGEIAAVDTRSEVYNPTLAPTLLKSTRLTLKDGSRIVLGYTNEQCDDRAFPYTQIGEEIARRAGVAVKDHGVVRRSLSKRVLGLSTDAAENTPLGPGEIGAINARHSTAMRGLLAGMSLLVVAGLAMDFATTPATSYAGFSTLFNAEPPAKR